MAVEQDEAVEQEASPEATAEAEKLWQELIDEENGVEPPAAEAKGGGDGKTGAEDKAAPASGPSENKEADDLRRQLDEIRNLVKTQTGRVASMQSELAKFQQAAAKAPARETVDSAAKRPEKWERLKTDFPDWAEAIEEFVAVKPADVAPKIEPDALRDEAVNAARIVAAKQFASWTDPEWESVVESEAFHKWLSVQPHDYVEKTQRAGEEWNAPVVLAAIRDYRKATAPDPKPNPNADRGAAKGRQDRLAAATVPAGTHATKKSTDDLEGLDYWKHLAREESARR